MTPDLMPDSPESLPPILSARYRYLLPEERIARYPLAQRDAARLLHYAQGAIADYAFSQLPNLLAPGQLLVFNNTRVIPARLYFQTQEGAIIEIFLLSPVSPQPMVQLAMAVQGQCTWQCMVGSGKKGR
jgi:S-adenosylmethionine:tRNA ribosyltransferase-isomerase